MYKRRYRLYLNLNHQIPLKINGLLIAQRIPSSVCMRKNLRNLIASAGNTCNYQENSWEEFLLDPLRLHLKHSGMTNIGTWMTFWSGNVLTGVDVVGLAVGAVTETEAHASHGGKDTVLVPVAAAFAPRYPRKVWGSRMTWTTSHLKLLLLKYYTTCKCIWHTYGACVNECVSVLVHSKLATGVEVSIRIRI